MALPVPGDGRITRERYRRFVEEGVIGPDDRVELLEGVIVSMSPQNPAPAFVVAKLNQLLSALGGHVSVRVQLPLDLSELSTPEPDLAVVSGRAEDYAAAHPTSALLVEVADGTVPQDRMTKGPMYPAAGVGEYWWCRLADPIVSPQRD